MSSVIYRLEPFHPWRPSQEKVRPSQNHIGIYRYPSPVSISTTPSPSNPINPISQSQQLYATRPERHPLPIRPPAEVCFNGDSQPNPQTTRPEPEISQPPSPINPGPEAFDFDDPLYFDDPPSSGDSDSIMAFEQIVSESEHQSLRVDSSSLDLDFNRDQHTQFKFLQSSIETRDFLEGPTIDPAILDDNHCRDAEQAQTPESTTTTTLPCRAPVEHSRLPVQGPLCHSRQKTPKGPVKAGRLPAKISKVSVVIDNRPQSRTSRSTPDLGRKNGSFPTFCAQFSALPAEERLQFLSWLFEGALSHYLHSPPRRQRIQTSRSHYAGERTKVVDKGRTPSSRKGLSWSDEEVRLLVKLRMEENLAWSDVDEQFSQVFPGRTPASIQMYWSKNFGKGRSSPLGKV